MSFTAYTNIPRVWDTGADEYPDETTPVTVLAEVDDTTVLIEFEDGIAGFAPKFVLVGENVPFETDEYMIVVDPEHTLTSEQLDQFTFLNLVDPNAVIKLDKASGDLYYDDTL